MRKPPCTLLSTTVLAFAFAGCTMIPRYTRPDAPVAAKFPGGPDRASDAADIRWRDFFTDPRLKRLVELALANNRDLRVAALTVERYQAEYRIQRAALLPSIDATGNYTRARSAGDTSRSGSGAISTTGTGTTGTGGTGTGGTGTGTGVTTGAAPVSTSRSTGTTYSTYSVSVGTTAYEVDPMFPAGRSRGRSRNRLPVGRTVR